MPCDWPSKLGSPSWQFRVSIVVVCDMDTKSYIIQGYLPTKTENGGSSVTSLVVDFHITIKPNLVRPFGKDLRDL
jgi:hypothetical protein